MSPDLCVKFCLDWFCIAIVITENAVSDDCNTLAAACNYLYITKITVEAEDCYICCGVLCKHMIVILIIVLIIYIA